MFHVLPKVTAVSARLPSSARFHEESVADSDEEKAQPHAYAVRSRGDFHGPLRWTMSLSELNLAAELLSALTYKRLEQRGIHCGFLSSKRSARDTTFMSRHATRRHRIGGAFARVEGRNG